MQVEPPAWCRWVSYAEHVPPTQESFAAMLTAFYERHGASQASRCRFYAILLSSASKTMLSEALSEIPDATRVVIASRLPH